MYINIYTYIHELYTSYTPNLFTFFSSKISINNPNLIYYLSFETPTFGMMFFFPFKKVMFLFSKSNVQLIPGDDIYWKALHMVVILKYPLVN